MAPKVVTLRGSPASTPASGYQPGQLERAATQTLAENAPGAEIAVAVRNSITVARAIGPALRDGRYADAAASFAQSTMEALSMLPAVPSLAGVIKAYHGSPHDFERFSLEKIGTGEGAQAYGHGLYFAENPGVAKSYQQRLADASPLVDGKPADTSNPKHLAAAYVYSQGGDRGRAVDFLTKHLGEAEALGIDKNDVEVMKGGLEILNKGDDLPKFEARTGSLYHVKIDVDHEDLLDWDSPLSEQSSKVKEALDKYVRSNWSERGILRFEQEQAQMTGGDFYRLAETEEHLAASTPSDFMQDRYFPPEYGREAASQLLREAGIPGIRYLDAGSRGGKTTTFKVLDQEFTSYDAARRAKEAFEGQGHKGLEIETVENETRNLVIFDDELIEIERRDK